MKNLKAIASVVLFLSFIIASCASDGTPMPEADIQVTNITESELVTGQITQTKTFDQCDSSSVFKTEVQFSDSNVQTTQQGLVLGAEVTGGGKVSGAIELEIKGSIEKHFSETQQQGQSRGGSVNIEVPPHTKQEYTIVWQEIRREGSVEYTENGQAQSTQFSYRIGLELVSSSGKDLPCNAPDSQPTASSVEQPALKYLKIGPNDAATKYASIWDVNRLFVRDVHAPTTQSFTGKVQSSVEYLFPLYWCAVDESTLAANRGEMVTRFYVNGLQIPDAYVLTYGYDNENGWPCINTVTALSGWTSGQEYTLQIVREFKSSIFDGETKYLAGTYIYEVILSAE